MPVVKCPSCGRALNLGDVAIGAEVQCPACQSVFQVPAAAPPPLALPPAAPESALDFGDPAPRPAPANPESPFEFKPDAEDLTSYTERRRLQTAGAWLMTLIVVEAVMSLICCVNGCSLRGNVGVFAVVGVSTVLLYIPLIFVGLGVHAISRRQSWGLAMAGAVIAVVLGAGNALFDLFLGLLLTGLFGEFVGGVPVDRATGCGLAVVIAQLILLFLGALGGLLGGIYAILSLNRYEIRRLFR